MGDGMSGLSLSEMGISVKKAGQAIKKAGSGVVAQTVQQVTGRTPNQIPASKPEPVFETDDAGNPLGFFSTAVKQVAGGQNPSQQQDPVNKPEPTYDTDDSGNPLGFLQGAAKQAAGNATIGQALGGKQPAQQGTFTMPKATDGKPPSETASGQAGSFDFKGLFDEKGFNSTPTHPGIQEVPPKASQEQQFAQKRAEDEQNIEKLRKQLHQLYYDDLVKKAEGKDQQKEETVQDKMEREEREEEEKKAKELEEKKKKETVPLAVKGRQGAHEGLKKQG